MSSPDGWTEGEGDLPFLPNEGERRFWNDLFSPDGFKDDNGTTWKVPLYSSDSSEPTYGHTHHVICCVCRGEGRTTEVYEVCGDYAGPLNSTCLACDGSGSVGMVRERKGTR